MEGKIYKITSPHTDKIYIGSTICSLHQRLYIHRYNHKHKVDKTTSSKILEYGDASIQLIETYKCKNKRELRIREQYHIDNNDCVNIKNAYRSKEDRNMIKKINAREYNRKNRQRINTYMMEHHYYKNSWGGDIRFNNNLLRIDPTLFS